ncbi:MAG TPA: ABC transporter permease subunit [Aggregatilineales bacterium]|nr:ABC transporter permease subunit [Aggregatilineales bacterium]
MARAATIERITSEPVLAQLVRARPRWLTWNWLGVLPFFIFLAFFQLGPALNIAVGALTDDRGHITLDNMQKIIGDEKLQVQRNSYLNTLEISVITTAAGGVLGFLLAWGITLGGLPRQIRLSVLSFCGVASNFAGLPLALAFIAAIGRTGTLTHALASVGISIYPAFSMSSFWGVCLAYTYFQIPLMVLVMVPPLDGLRSEWREAADNLGASRTQFWRLVMFPILLPSLLSALALLFANAFGAYATAFALVGAGAGESMVVSISVRAQFSNDSMTNPHLGYALAFGMILVIGLTVLIYTWSRQRAERWRRSIK